MKKSITYSATLLAAAAFCITASLGFAQINYGDFAGSTVTYLDVTEESPSGDPLPLFGAPTVSGNTLDFNPTANFAASASGAGGTDQTDGKLDFGIQALTGNFIPEVQFSEAGDYTLGGFGNDAFVSVTATLFVDVFEVDGAAISTIAGIYSMTFTPSNGDFQLSSPIDNPGGLPGIGGPWSGGVSIDIDQLLIDESVEFVNGATRVGVVIDNTLLAVSQDGTTAEIRKKDFKGLTITVVPEPSTAALGLIGLLGVLGTRRLRVARRS